MNGTCSRFNRLGLRAPSAAYHKAARALLKRLARFLTVYCILVMRVREPQVVMKGEQEVPSASVLCLAEGALATAVLGPMKTLVFRECGFSSKRKASAEESLAVKGWGCIPYLESVSLQEFTAGIFKSDPRGYRAYTNKTFPRFWSPEEFRNFYLWEILWIKSWFHHFSAVWLCVNDLAFVSHNLFLCEMRVSSLLISTVFVGW